MMKVIHLLTKTPVLYPRQVTHVFGAKCSITEVVDGFFVSRPDGTQSWIPHSNVAEAIFVDEPAPGPELEAERQPATVQEAMGMGPTPAPKKRGRPRKL